MAPSTSSLGGHPSSLRGGRLLPDALEVVGGEPGRIDAGTARGARTEPGVGAAVRDGGDEAAGADTGAVNCSVDVDTVKVTSLCACGTTVVPGDSSCVFASGRAFFTGCGLGLGFVGGVGVGGIGEGTDGTGRGSLMSKSILHRPRRQRSTEMQIKYLRVVFDLREKCEQEGD